jgi:hypothetical protein
MTQNQQILAHLKTGQTLTPLEALESFGCFRLASRIHDLKEDGWPITCDRLDVGNNKRVGHYHLVNDKDKWPTQ